MKKKGGKCNLKAIFQGLPALFGSRILKVVLSCRPDGSARLSYRRNSSGRPARIPRRPREIVSAAGDAKSGRVCDAGFYQRTCFLYRDGDAVLIIKYFMQVYDRCSAEKTDQGSGKYVGN